MSFRNAMYGLLINVWNRLLEKTKIGELFLHKFD